MAVFDGVIPAIVGAANAAGGDYQIERSLRFNSSDSSYLNKTFSSSGNSQTFSISVWAKRSLLSTDQNIFNASSNPGGSSSSAPRTEFRFNPTNDQIKFAFNSTGSSWTTLETNARFRDVSSWYHIIVGVDTTQATASDRVKIYINGVQQTLSGTYPTLNESLPYAKNYGHSIGNYTNNYNAYLDGYLADFHFIDGQQLAPSDFGEYDDNNVWQPKAYSGSYGTNGFHLDFSDNSSTTALGTDSSGNNNDWTPNNLSVTPGETNDSLIDTPTDFEDGSGQAHGNFCTWNPTDMEEYVILVLQNNLKTVTTSSTGDNIRGTLGFSSGKWYWECTVTAFSGGFDIGFATPDWDMTAGDVGSVAYSWSVSDSGTSKAEGSNTGGATAAFNSVGKVIGIAFDADAGSVKYYIDGVDQGVIFSGLDTSYIYIPAIYLRVSSTGGWWNFGQQSHTYAAPTGYKSLCTTNLADPSILDSSSTCDTKTYTGTGSAFDLDYNFSPDFAWIKGRSYSSQHQLSDTIRSASGNKRIELPSVLAQDGGGPGFQSTGLNINTNAAINTNGQTYVSWAWDAGSSTESNTDGTLTSNVRANTTAGFSIVQYTGNGSSGATVGHGLSAAPEFIILRNYTTNEDTNTYHIGFHVSSPANYYIRLNQNSARNSSSAFWNNTKPSSSVITLGNTSGTNGNTQTHIAYCWHSVNNYSKFGRYVGNSSTNGRFFHCGFRPSWLLIRDITSGSNSWQIQDSERIGINPNESRLVPNTTASEATSSVFAVDFVSNGFKLRTNNDSHNSNAYEYIYAAFAEFPFKISRAR